MGKLKFYLSLMLLGACTSINSSLESFDVSDFVPQLVLHAQLDQNGTVRIFLHESIPANDFPSRTEDRAYDFAPYTIQDAHLRLYIDGQKELDTTFTQLKGEFEVAPIQSGTSVFLHLEAPGYTAVTSEIEHFPEPFRYLAKDVQIQEQVLSLNLIDASQVNEPENGYLYFRLQYDYMVFGERVSANDLITPAKNCTNYKGHTYLCLREKDNLPVREELLTLPGFDDFLKNLVLSIESVNQSYFELYENQQFFTSEIDPAFMDPVPPSSNLSNNYGSFALRNIQRIPLK